VPFVPFRDILREFRKFPQRLKPIEVPMLLVVLLVPVASMHAAMHVVFRMQESGFSSFSRPRSWASTACSSRRHGRSSSSAFSST
jgi:hypothetical protein